MLTHHTVSLDIEVPSSLSISSLYPSLSIYLSIHPVEGSESGDEETMETLVAAETLLNMDSPDSLSLDQQHYSETHTHTQLV